MNQKINNKLLDIIACPNCKAKLEYNKAKQLLICNFDHIAYQIVNGIPIMLADKAKKLPANHSTNKRPRKN